MSMRVCAEVGCPVLVEQDTRDGRCDQHRRQRDKARGTRQERGYDAAHVALRADYQRRMDHGETFTCWRCEEQGRPHDVDPANWHLGHDDLDRNEYRGPECPAGNLATSGRTPWG